jgi:hypothetical protein
MSKHAIFQFVRGLDFTKGVSNLLEIKAAFLAAFPGGKTMAYENMSCSMISFEELKAFYEKHACLMDEYTSNGNTLFFNTGCTLDTWYFAIDIVPWGGVLRCIVLVGDQQMLYTCYNQNVSPQLDSSMPTTERVFNSAYLKSQFPLMFCRALYNEDWDADKENNIYHWDFDTKLGLNVSGVTTLVNLY